MWLSGAAQSANPPFCCKQVWEAVRTAWRAQQRPCPLYGFGHQPYEDARYLLFCPPPPSRLHSLLLQSCRHPGFNTFFAECECPVAFSMGLWECCWVNCQSTGFFCCCWTAPWGTGLCLCSAQGNGGGGGWVGGYEGQKRFVYLKEAYQFWLCTQNFIFPWRIFFLILGG